MSELAFGAADYQLHLLKQKTSGAHAGSQQGPPAGMQSGSDNQKPPQRSFRRRLWERLDLPVTIAVFAVTIIVIKACVSATIGRGDRAKAIASTIRDSSNLAVAFEHCVVRTIKSADAATHLLKARVAHLGAEADLIHLFAERAIDPELIAGANVINEFGEVIATSDAAGDTDRRAATATELAFHAER